MFYENLKKLCSKKGTTPTAVAKALKLSTAKVTDWKNGTIPKGNILISIADYFDVSVDYLLGRSNTQKTPIEDDERNIVRVAGRDGSYMEKRLTDEQMAALKTIIEQLPKAPDDI